MKDFTYTAISKNGHKETSTIQAADVAAAGHLLKEQGLIPTSLEEKHKSTSFNFLQNASTISLAEKLTFIQNLGIMLKAGISASRSLQILVKQTRNKRFQVVLGTVANQVEAGKSLAEALGGYPGIFSNLFVSMVRVGEMSGNLDKSLEYLSIQLEREADLRSKTKGAMIYPAVIAVAMVAVGVLMSIYILPNLTAVFKEMNADLPAATRVVIAFGDFMSAHAALVLLALGGVVVGIISWLRTPVGKRAADITVLRLPVFSGIVVKINLARFARVLSSLMKSGIQIVECLQVTSESMSNIPYRELTAQASVDVKLGKPLTEALGKDPRLFPILVVQMLEVGEESGTLEDILEQLAVHYEEEVDTTMRNLSSIIEPVLLLVIGVVVGFLAYALIMPMYNIGSSM